MTRVLVTGASGFIGAQTLAPLLRRGYEVHAVRSRTAGGASPAWAAGDLSGVIWHQADLLDSAVAPALVASVAPSHLLHLAWYAEPGRFWTSEENLRWVQASLGLLRAFAAHGGRRVTIAGTCAEYAWGTRTTCEEFRTPLAPRTLYGASKHRLRLIAEAHARQVGISIAWGRVFFAFGPGESPRRLGGSVASALVDGRPAPCSHGEQLRDFLSSIDVGDAFASLLHSAVEGPVNLASGEPVRIRDLVYALGEAAGRPELIELGALPTAAGEPEALLADVRRLREEVGWTPTGSLQARARETINWWRAQSDPAPSARATRR